VEVRRIARRVIRRTGLTRLAHPLRRPR